MSTVADSVAIEITIAEPSIVAVAAAPSPQIVLSVAGPQGPGNLHIGPTNQLGAGAGVWIETSGQDFNVWIEDGL